MVFLTLLIISIINLLALSTIFTGGLILEYAYEDFQPEGLFLAYFFNILSTEPIDYITDTLFVAVIVVLIAKISSLVTYISGHLYIKKILKQYSQRNQNIERLQKFDRHFLIAIILNVFLFVIVLLLNIYLIIAVVYILAIHVIAIAEIVADVFYCLSMKDIQWFFNAKKDRRPFQLLFWQYIILGGAFVSEQVYVRSLSWVEHGSFVFDYLFWLGLIIAHIIQIIAFSQLLHKKVSNAFTT